MCLHVFLHATSDLYFFLFRHNVHMRLRTHNVRMFMRSYVHCLAASSFWRQTITFLVVLSSFFHQIPNKNLC